MILSKANHGLATETCRSESGHKPILTFNPVSTI